MSVNELRALAQQFADAFDQRNLKAVTERDGRLEIPVGVSVYPRETLHPSRRWVDRWMPNLIHYNILERGGHFATWEQPALHAKEIRDCFAKVR